MKSICKCLYSIRMRASQGDPHEYGGRHISGAEKIVTAEEILTTVSRLVDRARRHEQGCPDFINLNIEMLRSESIRKISSLPVYTIRVGDYRQGRALVKQILSYLGIKKVVIEEGFRQLLQGPAPGGGNMRGAILMDEQTGRRLEPDLSRGVRVSRMDYRPGLYRLLTQKLDSLGLNNEHFKEALCLASKVISVPGITAELCWSDDPGYTAGYVASARLGYLRLPHLKAKGSGRGGRIFFLDNAACANLDEIIRHLEQKPYLITRLEKINGEMTWEKFKEHEIWKAY